MRVLPAKRQGFAWFSGFHPSTRLNRFPLSFPDLPNFTHERGHILMPCRVVPFAQDLRADIRRGKVAFAGDMFREQASGHVGQPPAHKLGHPNPIVKEPARRLWQLQGCEFAGQCRVSAAKQLSGCADGA